jgi:hypothetical protein
MLYRKCELYKIQIINKRRCINDLKKRLDEVSELQEKSNKSEKEYEYIKRKTQRERSRGRVSDEEIHYMVNDSGVNYKIDMCHINALKAFIELGDNAKIMIGQASYLDLDKKEQIVPNHLWIEYRYGYPYKDKKQLIDPINYKNNEKKKYFNHRGIELALYDHIKDKENKVRCLIGKGKTDSLSFYENDDMDNVYGDKQKIFND